MPTAHYMKPRAMPQICVPTTPISALATMIIHVEPRVLATELVFIHTKQVSTSGVYPSTMTTTVVPVVTVSCILFTAAT